MDSNGPNINHQQICNLRGGSKRLWDLHLRHQTRFQGEVSSPTLSTDPLNLVPCLWGDDHKFDSFEGKVNLTWYDRSLGQCRRMVSVHCSFSKQSLSPHCVPVLMLGICLWIKYNPAFGTASPHKAEREQAISEPVVVTVIFHYEQDRGEGSGKEITKSTCLLGMMRIGVQGRGWGNIWGGHLDQKGIGLSRHERNPVLIGNLMISAPNTNHSWFKC